MIGFFESSLLPLRMLFIFFSSVGFSISNLLKSLSMRFVFHFRKLLSHAHNASSSFCPVWDFIEFWATKPPLTLLLTPFILIDFPDSFNSHLCSIHHPLVFHELISIFALLVTVAYLLRIYSHLIHIIVCSNHAPSMYIVNIP